VNLATSESCVSLRSIRKKYLLGDTQVDALKGVDLEIKRKEFTALVGSSGSGKSTLLNIIGCLDEPDSGTLLIDGQNISSFNDPQKCALRNEKIGFVFQAFNLISVLTVFENIELPLLIHPKFQTTLNRDKINQVLEDLGLQDKALHLPQQLSGGERQRVAIARALVTDPVLILADEPTANLDSKTAHKIIDVMLELNRKRATTFFFCTHDEKLISRVDRTVVIKDGLIA
jgi:putative ABC transport system ATP-binding protein